MNAFDVSRRVEGHLGTGTHRTGERNHVDVSMRAQCGTDGGAVAVDQVEYAGGNACVFHDFGPNHCAER